MRYRIVLSILLTVSAVLADTSLTIYNQNFAVVRDDLELELKKGVNDVSVTEITAHLEPDSVILRDPEGKRNLQILEQNYRADPVSQGLLMSLYEGETIDFLSGTNIVQGKIIRSGYIPHSSGLRRYGSQYSQRQYAYASHQGGGQSIIEVDGKLRFSLPGQPLFPSLTDESILKPTISWLLETDKKGGLDAELCYITGGMSWEADYNLIAPVKGDTVDVIGWVTMDNQSGKVFKNAKIKLMAGDVSKINEGQAKYERGAVMAMAADSMRAPVSEKSFDEFHLYTLNRATTLRDRETKQVEFVRAQGVKAETIYIYKGAAIDTARYRGWNYENIRNNRDYGSKSNSKVWVMKEFMNSQANNLGIPLPKGKLRFYRRDDDGQLEFTGENVIDHTPKDEKVRVYTGNAFDLVGERKRTVYNYNHNQHWLDESFEIKVRNRKETGSVEIRVVENMYRAATWDIAQKSDDYVKTDSQTIEFRVKLAPSEQKIITYKVHYTW